MIKSAKLPTGVYIFSDTALIYSYNSQQSLHKYLTKIPDSKVHWANMGPTWVLSAPDGPNVGPMNLAMRDGLHTPSDMRVQCHRCLCSDLSVITITISKQIRNSIWAPTTRFFFKNLSQRAFISQMAPVNEMLPYLKFDSLISLLYDTKINENQITWHWSPMTVD